MYFRSESDNGLPDREGFDALESAQPSADDQRSHPRGGTLEKIADIAYDTLRKHEGAWQSDESAMPADGTPEDSR